SYPCSGAFVYFEPTNSCYGVFSYQLDQKWSNAESYCESFGGHLVSVHSYAEFRLIGAFAAYGKYAPWSGLFSNDGGRSWQWSDRSPVDYLPWQPGYPSGSGPCVALSHSGLINSDCNGEQPMICKIPL
uniref:C-type lectin domain-containing protein n=1 Tax=Panagrolaimus sp. ES5 TaxID=591445 RepID=A0AC34GGP5_9BILA